MNKIVREAKASRRNAGKCRALANDVRTFHETEALLRLAAGYGVFAEHLERVSQRPGGYNDAMPSDINEAGQPSIDRNGVKPKQYPASRM